ncbi:Hypothetical protein R9X50_00775100 [Acrodontium crateriforme]|uniref:CwfJ domain protein n=1 Tax=Acrodontium crateriforme TaxID=150365 RepID=A0AAQ3MBN3_9PEZI|nr:Hypothetical protein R9X50_00775100 [Acrodontium crateriforme]
MAKKSYRVVIGDVNGRLSEVFGKLATLHAKNSFAFAIIAGNLFASNDDATEADKEQIDQLLQGKFDVPLPTYFSLGRHALPESVVAKLESSAGELCPNLSVLGRAFSIKTSEGFRLMAVGGLHTDKSDEPMSKYVPVFRDRDVDALANSKNDVDLLFTNDWPAHILDGSRRDYAGQTRKGAQSLSDLCSAVKPRYHFSASDAFLEREPFFHNGPPPQSVTRFINLAPYGNAAKQKWIYAFSLEPSSDPPQTLPQECTASPFSQRKRKQEESSDAGANFRYSQPSSNGSYNSNSHRNKRARHQPPPTPQQCFFCLSNPTCETHMIAAIGEEAYLTVAKGPLTTPNTFPSLNFPGHILLIPHEHVPTMSAIASDEARTKVMAEMQRYREALHSMLDAKSSDSEGKSALGAVTWEISRSAGVHLHWQFLPVPLLTIEKGLVEAGFEVEAENLQYPKFVKSGTDTATTQMQEVEQGDYFKVQIWSPEKAHCRDLVLPLDQSFRFDLQFGRRVLGKLLGLESRTHWRDCAQSQEEEEKDAELFKAAFQDFDFSA